jgi:hypothetical protein
MHKPNPEKTFAGGYSQWYDLAYFTVKQQNWAASKWAGICQQ